jgi:hypothetical protein
MEVVPMRQWLFACLLCIFSATCWSTPADEQAVRDTFHGYKAAILDQQGVQAADRVSTGTLDAYQRYRELALSGNRATLQALPITEQLQVLIIRHRIPIAQLHAMNGRAVFIYAVDRGWIGRESVERTSIGPVQVDGDTAIARMRLGQAEAPLDFEFLRQQGQWRFDLMPVIAMAESVFAQMARQYGLSEDQLVLNLVSAVSGIRAEESLWDAPAP